MLAFMLLATTVSLLMFGNQPTPNELFREAVLPKLPSSVKIINSSRSTNWSGDVNIWLHFKISETDFVRLWESETFHVSDASEHRKFIFKISKPPTWWKTELLGERQICFHGEAAPSFSRDRSVKDVFVNERRTEVLLLHRSWYNY